MELSSRKNLRHERALRRASTLLGAVLAGTVLLAASAGQSLAWQITLAWDPNTDADLAGYNLYYGLSSGAYTVKVPVGRVTSHTITGLADGKQYYFAATAHDAYGNESGYSNEVQYGSGAQAGRPEIEVLGNAPIADGDSAPSLADFTDFGGADVASGAVTRTFTIRNSGTASLALTGSPAVAIGGANAADFTVTSPPATTVAAGTGSTFQVRFDPGAQGTRTATVSIANNDASENPFNFTIRGTGTLPPEIDIAGNATAIVDGDASPSVNDHTDFGGAKLGKALVTRTFTIRNTGAGALSLPDTPRVVITGTHAADFSVALQPPPSVAAGGSASFQVRFSPKGAGARTASIAVASSDTDESPYNFAVKGTGTVPEINILGNAARIADGDTVPGSTDHTDFGRANITGEAVVRTFTIQNTGSATLVMGGSPRVRVGGPHASDFVVTAQPPATLEPGKNAAFQVRFDPRAEGVRSATLSIANDDPDESPYDFAVQGTGFVAPEIALLGGATAIPDGAAASAAGIFTDFGATRVDGGTVARTFTIRNLGSAPLHLTGSPLVGIGGAHAADFTVSVLPATPLAIAGSATFKVVFDPSAPGVRTASVSVASDDADENPYNFAVQGVGTVPEILVSGNAVEIADGDASPSVADLTDFEGVKVGRGATTRTFTIKNTGLAPLALTGSPRVAIGGTHVTDFTVVLQPPASVGAGGSARFQVRFVPSAAGARSATITIGNNDANENPYNFSIRGTGTVPEINLVGNAARIGDGDGVPTAANHTDFGRANITGGTVTRTFTVQNTGTGPLVLPGTPRVAVRGPHAADFAVTAQPASPVAPAGVSTFQVRFDPKAEGLRQATISLACDDADENPYEFAIQGTGFIAPEISVAGNGAAIADGDTTPAAQDHTDFGPTRLDGGSVARTFTIRNTGSAELKLTGSPPAALGGANPADFTVVGMPAPTLAPGASATIKVVFDPTAAGVRAATLRIASDDADENPFDFVVQGEGVAPPAAPLGVSVAQFTTP